jgi:hypothetical protein
MNNYGFIKNLVEEVAPHKCGMSQREKPIFIADEELSINSHNNQAI